MSSIDNAKKVAGWQHPNQRAACRNCKHKQPQESADHTFCSPMVHCNRHGFYTRLFAICNDWADVIGVRG